MRHKLHQKSIFHQKLIQNDMPPNFWASKLVSNVTDQIESYVESKNPNQNFDNKSFLNDVSA